MSASRAFGGPGAQRAMRAPASCQLGLGQSVILGSAPGRGRSYRAASRPPSRNRRRTLEIILSLQSTTAADNRKRWAEEDVFMTLARYWRFGALPPCQPGVAWALVHFLVAFTLLGFYLQESDALDAAQSQLTASPPLPMLERELAVYAGPYFALLLPSQLLEIILTHMGAWKANQETVLMALRLCEGAT